jgi:RimJ/RimL family protein N-acetyltransferase
MAWTLTRNIDEFSAAAGDHLRAEPVLNTVPLTVLESLHQRGESAFGGDAPVYGWHESAGGQLDGAFLQTPPFPVLVATLPAGSAADLIMQLAAVTGSHGTGLPAAINLPTSAEADFSAAWAQVTGGSATATQQSRLFRLGRLVPPDPVPPGAARVAGPGDRELLIEWHQAFFLEAQTGAAQNASRTVDDRLSHGGLTLWEAGGLPVAMAGSTREVAGVVRIAGVYTVPACRQRGYGGAVTTVASQAALDAGVSAVVLFTDLANPTSNALYQRLGYRPVSDRVLLQLVPDGDAGAGGHVRREVTTPDFRDPDVTLQAPTPS